MTARHADVKVGPGPFNVKLAGEDAHVSGIPGEAKKNSCAGKFVPFLMY